MSYLVERVAAALWVASGTYPDSAIVLQKMKPIVWPGFIKQARAAIEAMKISDDTSTWEDWMSSDIIDDYNYVIEETLNEEILTA